MISQKGWWYYFPFAILFKEPFIFDIICLIGFISLFLRKEDFIAKLCLLSPPAAYLFVAMFINKVDIGIRHILPIYPFMFIIAGYGARFPKKLKYIKHVLSILLIVLAIDVLAAYPGHLSYFNRLLGGSGNGYKYLSDSNLSWGQDWKRLKAYLDKAGIKKISIKAAFTGSKNCDYYGIVYREATEEENIVPKKGVYVIEATELATGKIKWIEKIMPISRVGGSLLVYNIDNNELNKMKAE